jgi:predicted nuclease of predicted toxin-antitoxin system
MPKFLLDAQLPFRLKKLFAEFGVDTIHTLDLPKANATKDSEIVKIAVEGGYIVITKDGDFVESYLLQNKPEKLLFLSCGNISNRELEQLFRSNLPRIISEFEINNFIEIDKNDLIIHS